DLVEHILGDGDFREFLEEQIRQVGDLERIISRVSVGKISPREMVHLKLALSAIGPLKTRCESMDLDSMQKLAGQLDPCQEVWERIEREIVADPPALLNRGGVVSNRVSEELDELREIMISGKDYLLELQKREVERTGISSLKVGYNNVFGYYIEVRNTHKSKVPEEWTRKQTLVSAERYITEELKTYEEKILGAEEKSLEMETAIFQELVGWIATWTEAIQQNASLIARLDVLLSFARIALEYDYCRPEVNDSITIEIIEGRHPVIERQLPFDEPYVSNSIRLDDRDQQIIILTGPNMSGKSAFLRQTALITLMAQVGSYVPAKEARIGWVDKIFTRVGASDNLALGESTFMVEMLEAASILNNLSDRSLVILDEIGRGTSTYDGISIAWAMVEYIHEQPGGRAKTLFATHYHELNEMAASFTRVRNYNVSIREAGNRVIFLRKLVPGGSEHSFGIHVAQMAGMPPSVVRRAGEILRELEKTGGEKHLSKPVGGLAGQREGLQLSIFQLDDPVLRQIR
ncbi:MAG: DNA mismatch repair protein MutS, partial [Bacteroidetes bacterium]